MTEVKNLFFDELIDVKYLVKELKKLVKKMVVFRLLKIESLKKQEVTSFSRPGVSDDNPYIESFFKTTKYQAGYPKCFHEFS